MGADVFYRNRNSKKLPKTKRRPNNVSSAIHQGVEIELSKTHPLNWEQEYAHRDENIRIILEKGDVVKAPAKTGMV